MHTKLIWKGIWRKGELQIEAESLEELETVIDKLSLKNEIATGKAKEVNVTLESGLGCSDALRTLLESEWGKTPRNMVEIKDALEACGYFFSKGALSGTLTFLTRKGDIDRKISEGNWVYFAKDSVA